MHCKASLILAAGFVLVTTTDAGARPRKRTSQHRAAASSFFLAADPHVPLAVVAGGQVRQAVASAARGKACGNPSRWATLGSKWHELDAWGQIAGTFTVSQNGEYDVTSCAELAFSPKPQHGDTRLFVSADSKWRPTTSARWTPASTDIESFDALIATTIPDRHAAQNAVPSQCTSISERRRFFDVPNHGHFAVGTSNAGYVVARLAGGTWSVVAVKRSSANGPFSVICYRPGLGLRHERGCASRDRSSVVRRRVLGRFRARDRR